MSKGNANSKRKIIFVCTGNTCRSPMAQAMATQIFAEAGLECEVLSAGVNAWANQPASRHAISAMEEGGLCLLSHKASVVSDALLDGATLVLTMTGGHKAMLVMEYPGVADIVFTLGEYALAENDGVGAQKHVYAIDVSDPFGGSLEEYRACATQIREMLVRVAARLM